KRYNRALRRRGESCPVGKFQRGRGGGPESAIVPAGLDRSFFSRDGFCLRWRGRRLGICRGWLGFLAAGGDRNNYTKDERNAAEHGGFLPFFAAIIPPGGAGDWFRATWY